MMGFNTLDSIAKFVVDSTAGYGSEFVHGDAPTRTAMSVELIAGFLASSATKSARFFQNAVSIRKGYCYHSVASFNQGESVLNGINSRWFNSNSRFG